MAKRVLKGSDSPFSKWTDIGVDSDPEKFGKQVRRTYLTWIEEGTDRPPDWKLLERDWLQDCIDCLTALQLGANGLEERVRHLFGWELLEGPKGISPSYEETAALRGLPR